MSTRSATEKTNNIVAGIFEDAAWVRVQGKGSFQNSPRLRAFAEHVLKDGPSTIVVDLQDCPVMDSTFMGTLTGIAMLMKPHPDARLQVINANNRNTQLMQSLGLDRVLELDTTGNAWKDERELVNENLSVLEKGDLNKADQKAHVMAAHEALCEANGENVRRFRDVIDYLRKDMEEDD